MCMVEYSLRKANSGDFKLSYDIRKNALGDYVKQTWGWDEAWQLKHHAEDFNPEILSIIEVNGEPAGCLEVYSENYNMIVSGLYIIDAYQNLNIGTRIMSAILEEAKLKNAKVKLQVLKVNFKAKTLYEKLGFKVYNETEQHFQMINDLSVK